MESNSTNKAIVIHELTSAIIEFKSINKEELDTSAKLFTDVLGSTQLSAVDSIELYNNLLDRLQNGIFSGNFGNVPITILNSILQKIKDINQNLIACISNKAHFNQFGEQIANFHNYVWGNNLLLIINSPEQSENTIEKITQLGEELDSLLQRFRKADQNISTIESALVSTKELESKSSKLLEEAKLLTDKIEETTKAAEAGKVNVESYKVESETLKKQTENIFKESDAIHTKLNSFHSSVTENTTKIETIVSKAEQVITNNTTEIGKLSEKLISLQSDTKEVLELATGGSLFHAFSERQKEIVKSKENWFKISVVVFFTVVVLLVTMAAYAPPKISLIDAEASFTLKVLASLLGLIALAFCTSQYGKERHLEEQYAFKATLSLSLTPYKEVLAELNKNEAKASEVDFFISGVKEIFNKPTYEEKKKKSLLPKNEIDDAIEIIKKVSNATNPSK